MAGYFGLPLATYALPNAEQRIRVSDPSLMGTRKQRASQASSGSGEKKNPAEKLLPGERQGYEQAMHYNQQVEASIREKMTRDFAAGRYRTPQEYFENNPDQKQAYYSALGVLQQLPILITKGERRADNFLKDTQSDKFRSNKGRQIVTESGHTYVQTPDGQVQKRHVTAIADDERTLSYEEFADFYANNANPYIFKNGSVSYNDNLTTFTPEIIERENIDDYYNNQFSILSSYVNEQKLSGRAFESLSDQERINLYEIAPELRHMDPAMIDLAEISVKDYSSVLGVDAKGRLGGSLLKAPSEMPSGVRTDLYSRYLEQRGHGENNFGNYYGKYLSQLKTKAPEIKVGDKEAALNLNHWTTPLVVLSREAGAEVGKATMILDQNDAMKSYMKIDTKGDPSGVAKIFGINSNKNANAQEFLIRKIYDHERTNVDNLIYGKTPNTTTSIMLPGGKIVSGGQFENKAFVGEVQYAFSNVYNPQTGKFQAGYVAELYIDKKISKNMTIEWMENGVKQSKDIREYKKYVGADKGADYKIAPDVIRANIVARGKTYENNQALVRDDRGAGYDRIYVMIFDDIFAQMNNEQRKYTTSGAGSRLVVE